jgi:radical SAM superfamily enzyme YgiQ (UPF0313 family)
VELQKRSSTVPPASAVLAKQTPQHYVGVVKEPEGAELPSRRIALACLTPRPDAGDGGPMALPSFGIRRIQAAVFDDPDCPGHVVRLFDHEQADIGHYVRHILAFAPDILGLSIYVWSMECLIAVAREIRRLRPHCLIVFGGPSARAALFDLPFYRDPNVYLDAVVEGDGEVIFRDIARLDTLDRDSLREVRGLVLPDGPGWLRTPPAVNLDDPGTMPSPFQLGLMPRGAVAYLETFRGCPLSCRFCEWGVDRGKGAVFTCEHIVKELEAFERLEAPAVFLLDAGLNLNLRAFRNLSEAARRTGFLKKVLFWAEIYPSAVRDEHLEFLREIGPVYLGVGLQSRDPEVLRLHQRHVESPRFEEAVRKLASVTDIELQIIFGLPGDTPDGFRATLDYAQSLPAAVRAYHALVLPDALMTRGLPEWTMEFDPRTLAMISCTGWSRDDLLAMRAELTGRAKRVGGKAGDFWWSFPARQPQHAVALPA